MFRALKNPGFRIFFVGQLISTFGSLVQIVALNWLVYRLTNSPFLLGLVNFLRAGPIFFLGLFTGPLLDRWNRHRVLTITYALTALLSLSLALLIFSPYLSIEPVLLIATLQGCVNAIDTPGRHSFIPALIEKKEELASAIPLDSFVMNASRLIGPAMGGILIAAFSEGVCFLINTVCYGIATVTLLFIKPKTQSSEKPQPIFQEIKEGIAYVLRHQPIWSLLLLVGLLSLVGIPFIVLMLPIFARDILQGGPQALGFLNSGWAIGAIGGALYLASRKNIHGFRKKIVITSLCFGLSLIAFSQMRVLGLCLAVIAASGFLRMIQLSGSNTLIQTIVEEKMRGRVMTFFSMTFLGLAPFGNLLAGTLADKMGAPFTVFVGGVLCCLGALFLVKGSGERVLLTPPEK